MSLARMAATLLALAAAPAALAEEPLRPYVVTDDAIALPLADRTGDAKRGESLLRDRNRSLCLLCHAGPFPDPHAQGTLAPGLDRIGSRLSAGQLRLRIVDMKRLNPSSIMPSYYRAEGYDRVAAPYRDKPVLTAEEIEDVVAFLVTLKE